MDKRMFLAIGLSMAVLLVYYLIFPPPPAPSKPQQAPGAEQAQPGASAGAEASQAQSGSSGVTRPATVGASAQADARPAEAKMIVVDTPLYEARFDTRGGSLASFTLRNYRLDKKSIDWADLLPFLRPYITKAPQDLVADVNIAPPTLTGNVPFAVRFIDESTLTRSFENVVYSSDREEIDLTRSADGEATLVLTGRGPEGLTVEKRFTFTPDTYVMGYELAVANQGEQQRALRVATLFGEGPEGAHAGAGYQAHAGPIWLEDGSIETEDADAAENGLIVREAVWLGVTDTYFISTVKAETPISHAFYESAEVQVHQGDDSIWIAGFGVELPQTQLAPGNQIDSKFKLYLGPKSVDDMLRFGSKLEESLDLTLDILAQPMLALMRWFHTYTGNYGTAIILLTIVVRVLLFPLTYKGMLSIKRMQKLQPRVAALREKFKADKERLNKEMMGLYKKHKMNPLGGCLPIAFQIPIFFALYSALLGAIELRHSPFYFWIADLSSKDGLYITPILMGGTMLLQQRLTPASMDPNQRRIMMWMPVVFMFFMLGFPAGLVLYWLTSNTLSIVQQLLINRIKVPEPQD